MKPHLAAPCIAAAITCIALVVHTVGPSIARGAPGASPSSHEYGAAKGARPPSPYPASSAGKPHSSASASAEPAEAPPNRFDLPPLSKESLPKERSDPPSPAEWKTARLVEVTRRSPSARDCRVYLVREYLKVHCGMPMAGVRQLAGSNVDSVLFVVPKRPDQPWTDPPNGGEAIFPLRSGDARLFQMFVLEAGYESMFPAPSVVIDFSWPDGLDAPSVVIR